MVTSEYAVPSFKIWLYLVDSLVILVAPMRENGIIYLVTRVEAANKFTEITVA